MSRTQYETAETLTAESLLIDRVSEAWGGVEFKKMPISYRLDFAVIKDGQAIAMAEVKCRNHNFGRYPTLILSLSKWNAGLQYLNLNGLRFFLLIGCLDGIYYHEAQWDKPPRIEWGGRTTNTRDSADIEPVVHIPIEWFGTIWPTE